MSSSAATPPSLPNDWRERIGYAAYLLGCPLDLLRDAIGDDDLADLTVLHTYLTDLLAPQEQQ